MVYWRQAPYRVSMRFDFESRNALALVILKTLDRVLSLSLTFITEVSFRIICYEVDKGSKLTLWFFSRFPCKEKQVLFHFPSLFRQRFLVTETH